MKEILELVLSALTIIAFFIGGAWALLNHFWTRAEKSKAAEENSKQDRVRALAKLGSKFDADVKRLEDALAALSQEQVRVSERSGALEKSVEKLDTTVGNLREAVASLRASREKYLGEGAHRVSGGGDGERT